MKVSSYEFNNKLLKNNEEEAILDFFTTGIFEKEDLFYKLTNHTKINDLFFFDIRFADNTTPYSDETLDIKDNNSIKENPRPQNQLELDTQILGVLDLKDGFVFVESKFKKSIEDILKKVSDNENLRLFEYISDFDSFKKKVKTISNATFILYPSLFVFNDLDFPPDVNDMFTGLPDNSKITVNIKTPDLHISKAEKMIKTYENQIVMPEKKKRSLIFRGSADNDDTCIFKNDAFFEKINLEPKIDENKFHDYDDFCKSFNGKYKKLNDD